MWDTSNGAACYSGAAGQSIGEAGILTVGNEYLVSVEVSGMTRGQLRFDSFGASDVITQDGTYQLSGIATIPDLAFTALNYGGQPFNGCINFIYAVETPEITIIDSCNGSIVYTVPSDSMRVYKSAIQIIIPWDLPYSKYYVNIASEGFNYVSGCFEVADQACTILLSWTNEDNAFGIDYESLVQVNKVRVEAKLWHPQPKSAVRDIFSFSDGTDKIIYSKTEIDKTLTIKAIPEYIVEAIGIGKDHDLFYIDGIEYLVNDESLSVSWRKTSLLAPVEMNVKNNNDNLVNGNCK